MAASIYFLILDRHLSLLSHIYFLYSSNLCCRVIDILKDKHFKVEKKWKAFSVKVASYFQRLSDFYFQINFALLIGFILKFKSYSFINKLNKFAQSKNILFSAVSLLF